MTVTTERQDHPLPTLRSRGRNSSLSQYLQFPVYPCSLPPSLTNWLSECLADLSVTILFLRIDQTGVHNPHLSLVFHWWRTRLAWMVVWFVGTRLWEVRSEGLELVWSVLDTDRLCLDEDVLYNILLPVFFLEQLSMLFGFDGWTDWFILCQNLLVDKSRPNLNTFVCTVGHLADQVTLRISWTPLGFQAQPTWMWTDDRVSWGRLSVAEGLLI